MDENKYIQIKRITDRITNNPYEALKGKTESVVGSKAREAERTTFSKVREINKQTAELETERDKRQSLTGMLKETVFGLPRASFDVAKEVLTNPLGSAKQAAMGIANGLTLGAVDYLERRAFVNAFKEGYDKDITEEQVNQIAEKMLKPENNALSGIRGGSDFATILLPYAATEKLFAKGLAYAAPKFVSQYGRTATVLSNIGAWNTLGQIEESFKPETERSRAMRAAIDTGLGIAFPVAGAVFRKIRPTKFNQADITPLLKKNRIVPLADDITEDSLVKNAREKLDQLKSKADLTPDEISIMRQLEKNIDNVDGLYRINETGFRINSGLDDVKAVFKLEDGVEVATNNADSLKNFIKGSNNITYKKLKKPMIGSNGERIAARHEFNSKTGQHIIFATDDTTAANLAHELGHYFDTELTKSIKGLSKLVDDFEVNREIIEDNLAAFAVRRLGGEATDKQVSAEIKKIAKEIISESDNLSAARRGGAAANKPSERFADAVSEILTREGADVDAPTISRLIDDMGARKQTEALGGKVSKQIKKARPAATETTTPKTPQGTTPKPAQTSTPKSTQTTPKLERTPTGRQPKTPAIRSELITTDADMEVFLNKKVLSKMTGEKRISKTNQEIVERSLTSKMTEKEWNNILESRVGNLAEDVTKAKRFINDKVVTITDKLKGRNIEDLTGDELGDVMRDYNQLMETVEVFSGVRTELSNSFRSLGISVQPGENDLLRDALKQIQKVVKTEGKSFDVLKKMFDLRTDDVIDKYFMVWYPTILSGPKTTARNLIGTKTNLITETLSNLFTKEGRETFLDRVLAMTSSSKQAFNDAVEVFKGNELVISKFREAPPLRKPAFKGNFAFLNKLEYVGRFLDAQDAFFSSIASEGEIAAMRAGKYTYGLSDDAAINKINDMVGRAFGQRVTYRNMFDKTVLGDLGQRATELKNSDIKAVKAVSNFVIPFVRTVANVTDRKIDYVPFLNMFRVLKGKENKFIRTRAARIVRDAGLKGQTAGRVEDIVAERLFQQQMGKMYMGLTLSATFIPFAMAGRITGAGPKDKNERDTLMIKGWRPQSIILPGGVALPYQNLGPLSGILSMAGNIADGVKYNRDDDVGVANKLGNGLLDFMRGELDQSYLAGFSDIYDMISPYSYRPVSDVIEGFALNAIPVPALWTQTKDLAMSTKGALTGEGTAFEARDFDEKILNRIGITVGLEPKLNAFGEQMQQDFIWGLTPKLINTDDKVINWMDENNAFVGRPNRKQTIVNRRTGEKREMTPEEYTKFLSESGQRIYKEIERRVESGFFDRYSQEEREKLVDKIVRSAREQAKAKISY